jgi:hypothetical protein
MANKLQELEHIAAVVRALSVLHPAVNFTLSNSASRSLLVSTRKATSIRSRFLEIFAGNILYVNASGMLFCENVFSFLDHLASIQDRKMLQLHIYLNWRQLSTAIPQRS